MQSAQPTYKDIFNNFNNIDKTDTHVPASYSATAQTNPIFVDINKQLENMLKKINNFETAAQTEDKTIVKNSNIENQNLQALHTKLDNISRALLAEYNARKHATAQILAQLSTLTEALALAQKSSVVKPSHITSNKTDNIVKKPQNWQESLSQLFSDDKDMPPFGLHPYQEPLSNDGANRLIRRAANYQKTLSQKRACAS